MIGLWLCALVLLQKGGTTPAVGGFGYGAGLAIVIMLLVIAGYVFVAIIRGGRRRR
jgi:hypothetical protein